MRQDRIADELVPIQRPKVKRIDQLSDRFEQGPRLRENRQARHSGKLGLSQELADDILAICSVVRYDEHFRRPSQRVDAAPSEYLPFRLGRADATASDDLIDGRDRIRSKRRRWQLPAAPPTA